MKKLFIISALIMASFSMMAQQAGSGIKPVITFEKNEHDFGKEPESGRITTVFTFTNEGMVPFKLTTVRASCGCTTPQWPKDVIEPGEKGEITVSYNTNGRPGVFKKTITVNCKSTLSEETATTMLYIRGEVIPKTAQPQQIYNIKMGELSLKSNTLDFGTLKKGQNKVAKLEYANLTDHDITVDIRLEVGNEYLTPELSLKTLKPKEVGTLSVNFNTNLCPTWGVVNTTMLFVVNDKVIKENEYKVKVKADIIEDFSLLSAEELQNAPLAEFSTLKVDLGEVAAGKKVTGKIHLKNVGVNPLYIRRITSTNDTRAIPQKSTLKSGKSTDIVVEVLTIGKEGPLQPGTYKRNLVIITNDPKKSKVTLEISWTIK